MFSGAGRGVQAGAAYLSLPQLLQDAEDTVLLLVLDLVHTVAGKKSAEGQETHGEGVQDAEGSLRDVVDDTGLEARVAVVQEEGAHGAVEWRRACDEGRNNQWRHAQHDDPLKGPVERPVQLVWLWWHVGVVHGPDDVPRWLGDRLEERSVCNRGLQDALSGEPEADSGCGC